MASTDSTAAYGEAFYPDAWKPNKGDSEQEKISSFLSYFANMTKKMNSHLDFLQQHTPNTTKRNVEKGEPSSKSKRMADDLNRHPKVIIVSSDSEIPDSRSRARELQPKRNTVNNNANNDDDTDLNDDDDNEGRDRGDDSDDDGESDSVNRNDNEDGENSVQESDTYKSTSDD